MATYEEWKAAKDRMDAAKARLLRIQVTISRKMGEITIEVNAKPGVIPGPVSQISHPGAPPPLPEWPTDKEVADALSELRAARVAENALYNSLSPADQANIKR